MDLAKNRAVVSHEMSTSNRGVINPAERDRLMDPTGGNGGRRGRNAFEEPDEIEFGNNGRVGGGDPMNHNEGDGDFDGDPFQGY
jgi:hypothetical protein